MTGIFYGVGVGPGDPELMTLKARRVLNQAAVVVAPESAPGRGSLAADIARVHLDDPGKIAPLTFPMTYDRDALDAAWQANLDAVLTHLESGDVAFVTLGDPMLYSTCVHLMRHLRSRDVRIETVPGVPAFCAAAARLNRAVAGENETVAIIPAAYRQPRLAALLAAVDNVVVMKPSRGYAALAGALGEHGFLENAVMVSNCGHATERIHGDLRAVDPGAVEYLSIILASKVLASKGRAA
ncbi:MAG: precorrin-2 C(20)-methyltransferase [Candidatus Accumulibacter sp.]|nr:precorrin-2 C(20)-methyltransferase [Accumulibacter sp.]